ncbi:hypothetical protein [Pelagibacterium lentulum]|uniref:Uncharacterized protein n=1 Tax=Pelagibacterium lentulum TaxID=2029865 RepID=A0A916RBG4_9HYPH|nr:hypothetical protein [Pelagibacterium lentulum]GGA42589.1 hypothetical protein GCM10011499_10160 [Pelagibacterium lentulum]
MCAIKDCEHATLVTQYSDTDFAKFDLYNEVGITAFDDLAFHRITSSVNFRFGSWLDSAMAHSCAIAD